MVNKKTLIKTIPQFINIANNELQNDPQYG